MAENGSLGLGGKRLPADAWFIHVGKETGMWVGDYADAGQKAFAANTCRGCAASIWDALKCAIFLQADFIFFVSDADAFLSFSTRLMKIYRWLSR